MQMCAALWKLICVVEWNLFPSLEKRDLPSREILSLLNKVVILVIPMDLDENIISAFTVGDQLLWGASEPLRRMLCILINKEN